MTLQIKWSWANISSMRRWTSVRTHLIDEGWPQHGGSSRRWNGTGGDLAVHLDVPLAGHRLRWWRVGTAAGVVRRRLRTRYSTNMIASMSQCDDTTRSYVIALSGSVDRGVSLKMVMLVTVPEVHFTLGHVQHWPRFNSQPKILSLETTAWNKVLQSIDCSYHTTC